LLRGVHSAELLKRGIIKRLHAERDAINARRTKAAKTRCFYASRIRLKRYLGIGSHCPVFGDAIEDGLHRRRLHQGRRAAAKENARYHPAGHTRSSCGDLVLVAAKETGLVDAPAAHVTVEVTIRAFRQAEWPVHINGERRC